MSAPPHLRERYETALRSPHWRKIRAAALTRCGGFCERHLKLGAHHIPKRIEIHHLTYERLGAERVEDVTAVCPPCHEVLDRERAASAAQRSVDFLEWARLDGWATKVYGEQWQYERDHEEVSEAFDRWIEEHEE